MDLNELPKNGIFGEGTSSKNGGGGNSTNDENEPAGKDGKETGKGKG